MLGNTWAMPFSFSRSKLRPPTPQFHDVSRRIWCCGEWRVNPFVNRAKLCSQGAARSLLPREFFCRDETLLIGSAVWWFWRAAPGGDQVSKPSIYMVCLYTLKNTLRYNYVQQNAYLPWSLNTRSTAMSLERGPRRPRPLGGDVLRHCSVLWSRGHWWKQPLGPRMDCGETTWRVLENQPALQYFMKGYCVS